MSLKPSPLISPPPVIPSLPWDTIATVAVSAFAAGYLVHKYAQNLFLDKATERAGMSLIGTGLSGLRKKRGR